MKERCKAYFQMISDYLDGDLEEKSCRRIEAHLQECPECRTCSESLKKTILLCKKGSAEEIPDHVRERLRSALRECFGGA